MAAITMYDVAMEMPTVALWVPQGADAHPVMVEVLGFAEWPQKAVCIRGLGVKEQWVPISEIQVMQRSDKVKVVSWLSVVQFPERRG